jgi:hypothetical protein
MILFRLLLLLAALSPFAYRAATDDGRGIDPNGGLTASSVTCDEGNGLDPHGGCRGTNAFGEKGAGLDPNG